MLRSRCRLLLGHLDRAHHLLQLSARLEHECAQVARGLEAWRQRCVELEQDGHRAREQLARVQVERATLEVKLKHARNQVQVEMRRRQRAEAELEKQDRQLQLICGYLMQEPSGPSGTASSLALGRRLSVVDESGASLLSHSGISYDPTDDDLDLDVTVAQLKRRSQERQRSSLAPVVGPVMLAKHSRPLAETTMESEPQALLAATVITEGPRAVGALPPVPRRRSRQAARLSALAAPGDGDSGAGMGTVQAPEPPSPLRGPPTAQHLFTSKKVLCPEACGECGARLRFGRVGLRCRRCCLLLHNECRPCYTAPCTPGPRTCPRQGVLADFAPLTPPRVPALVVQCVHEVESRGLAETGLYRVPGAESLVREWRQKLLRGRGPAGRVPDVHVACGVLKDFLRGLREPLVTFRLHPAFLRAADLPDAAALCHVVMQLPPANRDTLAFLVLHLLRVARSPACKMDRANLARVFGPTLVGYGSADPPPLTILEDTPRQCKVVDRLLSLPPEFWQRFMVEEQEDAAPTAHGSEQALLPPALIRDQLCPDESSRCRLPTPRPAPLHQAPAGIAPQEDRPLLPLPALGDRHVPSCCGGAALGTRPLLLPPLQRGSGPVPHPWPGLVPVPGSPQAQRWGHKAGFFSCPPE
ncbi:rac GTPase-activating protein 1 isoform X2 [Alligator mississippiensis]|uniref:rac GTPase-activating protein 1 isoform X2 n=1 Tax=Alligator mississippiensis TaxID=8496 RepID=UPI002877D2E4|nr:rac GTPase-activating protein 1 isoform X2 [Alligator mississippiensis]